jgi:hypothetical protein
MKRGWYQMERWQTERQWQMERPSRPPRGV